MNLETVLLKLRTVLLNLKPLLLNLKAVLLKLGPVLLKLETVLLKLNIRISRPLGSLPDPSGLLDSIDFIEFASRENGKFILYLF
ncbi:MAG: hypothetical protein ACE3JK_15195 [Sporolactobacillus sp.]